MSLSIGEVFRAVADGRMSAADGARILMGLRPESIPVPRETLERVRETLARLAHLEAAGHRAGLMSNDSRAALEDLDRLLETR